jgi:uncharacterized membrane protein
MLQETVPSSQRPTSAIALAPSTPAQAQLAANTTRLAPLDWMRGLVMVLMAVDHSSKAFNAGRIVTDSFFTYRPGSPLPLVQFLARFVTHLCAPTFLFLAGTGLAFTVQRQIAKGESAWAIDRSIATRGLAIAGFESWISWFTQPSHTWMLQVLYAIGVSFLFMVPLRRLPSAVAVGIAIFLIFGGEAWMRLAMGSDRSHAPLLVALLVVGGERMPFIISYPAVHWLAMLLLGWVWGRMLVAQRPSTEPIVRQLTLSGIAALLVFIVVRGVNGYGNMLLLRDDGSLAQWLHVSKYPPSLAYTALELGIMALILAAFFQLSLLRAPKPGLLTTLGQTPMFFYLLHYPLLILASRLMGVEHQLGLVATFAAAAGVIALLYPLCRWYRPFKASGRYAWTRYV